MLRVRVIPCLLVSRGALVKTVRFRRHSYIGDPANTCRIFNELEVDELAFMDIKASREGLNPDFKLLEEIANECFMPVSYGGGIRSVSDARQIFRLGFEKVIVNSAMYKNPELIDNLASEFGSQSIIASIDVKKGLFGKPRCVSHGARERTDKDPLDWAKELEARGAGEILLTSVDHEGTWKGFDYDTCDKISNAVDVPVIMHGGAGKLSDLERVVKESGASAVGLGSMVVYQREGMGVLVNFPSHAELERILN